ncbi:MAG TPA: cyclic nucleotide-binding domain-containing protein [Chthoniobacterales bacterium]|nr:cyclic nucleotide-binding domain-containing protein [Chthoniobacterales bacterium]
MPARDFFAFCTSLHPIELRAVGALSQVRHLPEGETIYAPGEPADILYIINRGRVEILPATSSRATPGLQLTRGDIFGDLEVLTNRPRAEIARACEPVSLQCFHRQDFAQLQGRVPLFFRYLCEQLAHRFVEAREAATLHRQSLELGGSLANFDLVTIYQTIAQSSQTGELSIMDEGGHLHAAFQFEAGQPLAGHFEHLTGEEAFWQLFLAENRRGTFSFSSDTRKWSEPRGPIIARKADDMLINALQFRDEFHALKATMPGVAMLELKKPALVLETDRSEIPHFLLEQIWRRSQRGTPLAGLYPHFSVCELKIYQAVRELVQTGHLALSAEEESQKVA